MGILKGLLTLNPSEVIGSTVKLTKDVITSPLDVIEDIATIPQDGDIYPEEIVKKTKNIVDDIL